MDPSLILTILGTILTAISVLWLLVYGSKTIPELRRERKNKVSASEAKNPGELTEQSGSFFKSVVLYKGEHRLTSVSCSPSGDYVALAGFSSRPLIVSTDSASVEEAEAHNGIIRSVKFHPDDHAIASAGDDGAIKIAYPREKRVNFVGFHDGPVYSVTFHPDKRLLASGGKDGTIRLWDTQQASIYRFESEVVRQAPKPALSYDHKEGAVFDIDFNKTGTLLASGGLGGSVRLWNLSSGESEYLAGFQETVFCVCFDPTAEHLAASGAEGDIRVWSLSTRECQTFIGHADTARWLCFDPSGRLLVSASKDRTVRVWELATKRSWILDGHDDYVYSVSFHPSGKKVFSAGGDGTLRMWDLSSLERGE
jgi:WD40 repeat protein